jgi:hypothetical protein
MIANRRRSPIDRFGAVFVLTAALALAFAACTSGPPSSSPSATAPVAASSPRSASAAASGGSTTSQTATEWGRIWDTLPAGFPAIEGSTPSEEAANGPASATMTVDGNAAQAITTSMQSQLETMGYRTAGLQGPLEDGSYVLESLGTAKGCIVQVTAKPLGGITTVTVMYGAVCPHE